MNDDSWAGLQRGGALRLRQPAEVREEAARLLPRCRLPQGAELPEGVLLVADQCPARLRPLPLAARRVLGLRAAPSEVTVEDLEALGGIGPRLARAIVAFRRARGGFESVEDFDEVPGVGAARMSVLRTALTSVPP